MKAQYLVRKFTYERAVSAMVPRLLALGQTHLIQCLEVFHRKPNDFCPHLMTANESWFHHYTPVSKQ